MNIPVLTSEPPCSMPDENAERAIHGETEKVVAWRRAAEVDATAGEIESSGEGGCEASGEVNVIKASSGDVDAKSAATRSAATSSAPNCSAAASTATERDYFVKGAAGQPRANILLAARPIDASTPLDDEGYPLDAIELEKEDGCTERRRMEIMRLMRFGWKQIPARHPLPNKKYDYVHPMHGIASSKKAALAYHTCDDYGGSGLSRLPPALNGPHAGKRKYGASGFLKRDEDELEALQAWVEQEGDSDDLDDLAALKAWAEKEDERKRNDAELAALKAWAEQEEEGSDEQEGGQEDEQGDASDEQTTSEQAAEEQKTWQGTVSVRVHP